MEPKVGKEYLEKEKLKIMMLIKMSLNQKMKIIMMKIIVIVLTQVAHVVELKEVEYKNYGTNR
jgi:hypothetical protein